MPLLALRADASVQLGSGHVRRCLALAAAASLAGVDSVFLCRRLDDTAAQLLADCGVKPLWLPNGDSNGSADADACANLLRDRPVAWVLVDHYGLDATWHDRIRARLGCRVAAVDDLADRELSVDLLVDGNDSTAQLHYAQYMRRKGQVLGGPRFALLHPTYADALRYVFHPQVRSIGVFMGATDPTGACLTALHACQEAGFDGPIEIVCSPVAPHFKRLEEACARRPETRLTQYPGGLDAFFRRHDLHLGSGGVAAWERCCLGSPTIAFLTADNQRATLPRIAAKGAVRWIEAPAQELPARLAEAIASLLVDSSTRLTLSMAARELVDGRGSVRVAALLACSAGVPLVIRSAKLEDEAQTYRWANDTTTRLQAFRSQRISAPEHAAWLRPRLGSPHHRLLLVEAHNGVGIGLVRLELKDDAWEISYVLDPFVRGFGLAARSLQAALAVCPELVPLVARVKKQNEPSLRVFRRLGFHERTVTDDRGEHVVFTCDNGSC